MCLALSFFAPQAEDSIADRAIGLLLVRREHGTLRQEDNAAGKGFAFTGHLDENPLTHLEMDRRGVVQHQATGANWPHSWACRPVRLVPGNTGMPSPRATIERPWSRCGNLAGGVADGSGAAAPLLLPDDYDKWGAAERCVSCLHAPGHYSRRVTAAALQQRDRRPGRGGRWREQVRRAPDSPPRPVFFGWR